MHQLHLLKSSSHYTCKYRKAQPLRCLHITLRGMQNVLVSQTDKCTQATSYLQRFYTQRKNPIPSLQLSIKEEEFHSRVRTSKLMQGNCAAQSVPLEMGCVCVAHLSSEPGASFLSALVPDWRFSVALFLACSFGPNVF